MSFFNFNSDSESEKDSGFSLFGGGPDTFPSDNANPMGFLEGPEVATGTSLFGDVATPTKKDGCRGFTPAFDATHSNATPTINGGAGFRSATGRAMQDSIILTFT